MCTLNLGRWTQLQCFTFLHPLEHYAATPWREAVQGGASLHKARYLQQRERTEENDQLNSVLSWRSALASKSVTSGKSFLFNLSTVCANCDLCGTKFCPQTILWATLKLPPFTQKQYSLFSSLSAWNCTSLDIAHLASTNCPGWSSHALENGKQSLFFLHSETFMQPKDTCEQDVRQTRP